jgi:hypothetical protein
MLLDFVRPGASLTSLSPRFPIIGTTGLNVFIGLAGV